MEFEQRRIWLYQNILLLAELQLPTQINTCTGSPKEYTNGISNANGFFVGTSSTLVDESLESVWRPLTEEKTIFLEWCCRVLVADITL